MELLRLLLQHPQVEIVAVTSRALVGKSLADEFPRFRGIGNSSTLQFTAPYAQAIKDAGAEIAFLALPHGVSVEFARPLVGLGLKVIDRSADFRLHDPATYKEFDT